MQTTLSASFIIKGREKDTVVVGGDRGSIKGSGCLRLNMREARAQPQRSTQVRGREGSDVGERR